MDRIEEFKLEGKNFIFIDLSGLKTGEEFSGQFELIKPVISKYPELSLYLITNISEIRFDSKIKGATLDFLKHNKPYVKYSVAFGADGIKKIVLGTMTKSCGRNEVFCVFTKEKAIEWSLQQP